MISLNFVVCSLRCPENGCNWRTCKKYIIHLYYISTFSFSSLKVRKIFDFQIGRCTHVLAKSVVGTQGTYGPAKWSYSSRVSWRIVLKLSYQLRNVRLVETLILCTFRRIFLNIHFLVIEYRSTHQCVVFSVESTKISLTSSTYAIFI